MKNIVVAIDGSDNARKARDLAIEMAKSFGSRLTLVYVNNGHALTDAERHLAETEFGDTLRHYSTTTMREDVSLISEVDVLGPFKRHAVHAGAIKQILGEGILAAAKTDAEETGLEAVDIVFRDGDPATEVIAAAKKAAADMIVVGSRGLGNVASLLMGSVSHKIANLASCSVMIVR